LGNLLTLKRLGVAGAVVGKAIYENRVDLVEALRATAIAEEKVDAR